MDTLYAASGSSSLIAAIALETCNHEYTLRMLSLNPAGAGDESYAQLSALRRVPVLVTANGPVQELIAIVYLLDKLHPEAELLPGTGTRRVTALSWLSMLATELLPVFRFVVRPERLAVRSKPLQIAVRQQAGALFGMAASPAASVLSGSTWLLGDCYSIADAYLATATGWARMAALPIAQDAALLAHAERTNARPEVARARQRHGTQPAIVREQ